MKITSVEAIPLVAEFKKPFRFAGVDRIVSQNVVVVIRTDDGFEGFGEACPVPHLTSMSQKAIVTVIESIASPILKGEDPRGYRVLHRKLQLATANDRFTLAALDTAILDLAGKAMDVPICQLLGGPHRTTVPVHASVSWAEDAGAMIDEAVSLIDDFRYLKVYLGRGDLRDDLSKLIALRQAIGADTELMLDINEQWTASETLSALPTLVELGVRAIEQPIRQTDIDGLRRITAESPLDIVLDESITTSSDVAIASRLALGTVANVGVSKLGGIVPASAAATAAYACGMGVAVGSLAELGIATAAGVHLSAALPELTYPSYLTGNKRYINQITEHFLLGQGGTLEVPQRPGLGIAIDEQAIRALDARSVTR